MQLGWNTAHGIAVLQQALPLLLAEHDWWMNPANHHVVTVNTTCGGTGDDDDWPSIADDYAKPVSDDAICSYTVNRYHSNASIPRPEAYTDDVATCNETATVTNPPLCYTNVRSGAETGWDYSSRWLTGSFQCYLNITIFVFAVKLRVHCGRRSHELEYNRHHQHHPSGPELHHVSVGTNPRGADSAQPDDCQRPAA
jgi:neutral trehalase